RAPLQHATELAASPAPSPPASIAPPSSPRLRPDPAGSPPRRASAGFCLLTAALCSPPPSAHRARELGAARGVRVLLLLEVAGRGVDRVAAAADLDVLGVGGLVHVGGHGGDPVGGGTQRDTNARG
uniref:Uncharacterized protein n=1 Tax=Aegilops tauschii subsp. strangulata TaxID=200361 RepID=A0A453PK60_AEGTS